MYAAQSRMLDWFPRVSALEALSLRNAYGAVKPIGTGQARPAEAGERLGMPN